MRALIVPKHGLEHLTLGQRPTPRPGPGELRLRVSTASLNPVDIETVAGDNKMLLPLRPPFVPGCDAAGVVEALGDGVTGFAVGDRVVVYAGVPVAGCLAEQVCAPASAVAKVPEGIGLETAAALALAGVAAYEALEATGVGRGSTVLIHGAAGAVGGAATQMALDRGAEVIAHLHSRDRETAEGWGVARAICYDQQDFAAEVSGLDAVVDVIGGATLKRSLGVVGPSGQVASQKAIPPPKTLRAAGFTVPALLAPVLGLMAWLGAKPALRPIVSKPSATALNALMSLAAAGRLSAAPEVITPEAVGETLVAMKAGEARGKHVVAFG